MRVVNGCRSNTRKISVHLLFELNRRRKLRAISRDRRLRPADAPAATLRNLRSAATLLAAVAWAMAVGLAGCGTTGPGLTGNNNGSLVISTQSVNFGSVAVGQTANATISVSNPGSAAVSITQLQVQGAAFALTGQNNVPISVAGGASYSLGLSFSPTATGTATGALVLTSNISTDPQVTISLSGTGESVAAPALSGLSCSSNSMTGAGTDACTVTLTAAAGTGGLTVDLSSSSAAVSVPGSVTVAAGATSAGFTATVSAVTTAQSAVLTASAGSVTETYTIQLGVATPALTLQSTNVNFGDVTVNSPAIQTVLLTSSGTAPATISAATVTGAGFSLTGPTFPLTLQLGQTANLSIQFDPQATGAVTGTVTLTTNTPSGSATIQLSGTGAASSYEVELTWNAPTDSTDPVTGYDIYRTVSGSSSYQKVGATAAGVTNYTDTSVQNGTAYTYYVVSFDASGNQSTPSNLFSASIP